MQESLESQADINRELLASGGDEPDAVLRARFAEYGYLYFPAFVAGDQCDALLEDILASTAPFIAPGEPGPQLAGEPFFETDPAWDRVYPEVQSLERFHRFFHTPEMLALQRRIVDAEPFVYPMKMARISTRMPTRNRRGLPWRASGWRCTTCPRSSVG